MSYNDKMIITLTSFFASLFFTFLIVYSKNFHQRLSSDFDLAGPQKFHTRLVPRIGGLSISLSIITIIAINPTRTSISYELTVYLLSIPVFLIGFTEDLTKKISANSRLFVIAISAALFTWLLETSITRLDIPVVDLLLSTTFVSIIFTVFAITGLTNAYNIIDGFNGLASMVGIITLTALSYVAFDVGDDNIMLASHLMIGSILGFFVWNYPKGSIFLGDGGAYLIGFWIATLSIILVTHHQSISPWFALLVNAYPILETLFSIYRRTVHQGKSPGLPDGLHFHTLIFRRIINTQRNKMSPRSLNANPKTSPLLWMFTGLSVVPAILCRQSTPVLMFLSILFVIFYIWIYRQIAIFKTPKWLKAY